MASWSRDLIGGLCELGRPRSIPIPPRAVRNATTAGSGWRLRFGERLVVTLAATPVTSLALPVLSRDDFKARMSDLASVLEGLKVPDALLGKRTDVNGALNRLESALSMVGLEGVAGPTLPAAAGCDRANLPSTLRSDEGSAGNPRGAWRGAPAARLAASMDAQPGSGYRQRHVLTVDECTSTPEPTRGISRCHVYAKR